MTYTHILWDFNGTILNDVDTGIISVNTLLSVRGLPVLRSVEDYHRVFGFPIIEYYQRLGFDFEKEPYDKIAHEWVALYLEHVKKADIYDGVRETLDEIKKLGPLQIILSASKIDMLEEQLSFLGVREYFSEVLGLGDIYAHSKVEIGRAWMEKVKPDRALLIGDTEHDFDVAQAIGADCVLVEGGHQPREKLEKCGVKVIKNIKEIINIL